MPVTIDWPLPPQPRRPRRRLFIFIAILAVLLLMSRTALSWWVNLLWFRSLGYGGVFWKSLGMEWGVFAGFAVLTFAVLYGAFAALMRTHASSLPETHAVLLGGQNFDLPVARALRVAAAVLALLISLASGGAMAAQ